MATVTAKRLAREYKQNREFFHRGHEFLDLGYDYDYLFYERGMDIVAISSQGEILRELNVVGVEPGRVFVRKTLPYQRNPPRLSKRKA